MAVAAELANRAFSMFHHWTIRCFSWSFVIAAISWGGFSVAIQTIIPETGELRRVIGLLSLGTKVLSAILAVIGLWGMWKHTSRFGQPGA